MSKLIALSDGHGVDTAGKRTPTLPSGQKSEIGRPYMNENLFNRAVVNYLDAELKRHGFRTILVAPTDADTPLATRTKIADDNKVDLYMSVHANALAGKWGYHGGIETYTYGSGESLRIGKLIHAELLKGSSLKDRGVKDGSHLWEIRKPKAPSVLAECGFMDSHNDYKYLISDAYRRECAIEIAKGICKAFGVTYKEASASTANPTPTPTPSKPVVTASGFYTVVKGDTLSEISVKFNTTIKELKANNGLTSDLIKVGQKLVVPSSVYTVVKGDTLSEIADKFDTTVASLKSLNGLKSDLIKVGQELKISATSSKPVSNPTPAPKPAPAKPVVAETPSNVYGTLTVKVANLNVRADANFNAKIVDVAKKGEKFNVYSQKNGLYNIGANKWVSAGTDYVSFTKSTAHKIDTKRVQILVSQLWTYNKADWNAKSQIVKKNEVYTIARELTVDGAKMYQLKSGLYISANPKYVKIV